MAARTSPLSLTIVTAVAIPWLIVPFVQYWSLELNGFDTGIYANQIAIFHQRGSYYSSILRMPALGEHWTPALLLFAPILTTPLVLLAAKSVSLILAGIFLYRFASFYLSKKLSLYLLLGWFLCRPVNTLVIAEFQPSTLAVPLIPLAFLLLEKGKIVAALIPLIALFGFKEHLGLIWISAGLFLIVEKRRKEGWLLVFTGIIAGLLIYLYLMPYFADGLPNSHSGRLAPMSLPGEKLKFLLKVFSAVIFTPLLSPTTLVWILPAFSISLISNHELMVAVNHHYHDVGMPLVFMGAAVALGKRGVLTDKRVAVLAGVVFLIFNHRLALSTVLNRWPTETDREIVDTLTSSNTWGCNSIAALDSLTPYLFTYSNLTSLLSIEELDDFKKGDCIVYTSAANPWPLTREQIQIIDQLPADSWTLVRRGSVTIRSRM